MGDSVTVLSFRLAQNLFCLSEGFPRSSAISQLPPTLSVACNGKTADNVLRLALKGVYYS
jgi:hypothetical protein